MLPPHRVPGPRPGSETAWLAMTVCCFYLALQPTRNTTIHPGCLLATRCVDLFRTAPPRAYRAAPKYLQQQIAYVFR